MKILVCFKISESMEEVTDNEWNHCLDKADIPVFFNTSPGAYDEAALETALQIKDAFAGGDVCHLTALTIGPELSDTLKSRLFGIKYDRIVHIKTDEDLRFCPESIADVIADFVKENGGYDIILMGQQSMPGENAATHLITASKLNLPCVLNVISAEPLSEGIGITSIDHKGRLEQKMKLPIVLAIGDAIHPYLRVATLRERMLASKKEAEITEGVSVIKDKSDIPGLYRKKTNRSCLWIEGENTQEKIQKLYKEVISTLR